MILLFGWQSFGVYPINCPWHSRQCLVAPELSCFSLKLSFCCSMVPLITFFLVLPIYRALQVQSNWQTPGKLLGSSFDLFLQIKFFKLHPELKMVFIPNFSIFFLSFGLNFSTLITYQLDCTAMPYILAKPKKGHH